MYTVTSTSNDVYAPDHIVLSGSRRLSLFRATFDATGQGEDRRERRRDTMVVHSAPRVRCTRARSCRDLRGVGRTRDPSSSNRPRNTSRLRPKRLQRDHHVLREGLPVRARPDTRHSVGWLRRRLRRLERNVDALERREQDAIKQARAYLR